MKPIRPELPTCVCHVDECVLCEANLFSNLESNQVCDIKGMVNHQTFKRRDVIFSSGTPCDRLHIIKEGMVRLSVSLPDGREQVMCPRGAGQLIGLHNPDKETNSLTAVALTDVNTCSIKHSDMQLVLAQNPGAALNMINHLTQEVEKSQVMIRNLGLKSASEKVVSFFLSLIPIGSGDLVEVPLPLSRHEIGEMLGLSDETVSRVITELKHKEIIDAPRGGIVVKSQSRLRELSGDQENTKSH